jgi:hypothetical protein
MFILKDFSNDDLEKFFEIFKELGVIEIEADWAAQGNFEEFSSHCWILDDCGITDDLELSTVTVKNQDHSNHINNSSSGIVEFLDNFLKSCIPSNYKENLGSFGFIKFKIEEKDYEIVKFEYSRNLDDQ